MPANSRVLAMAVGKSHYQLYSDPSMTIVFLEPSQLVYFLTLPCKLAIFPFRRKYGTWNETEICLFVASRLCMKSFLREYRPIHVTLFHVTWYRTVKNFNEVGGAMTNYHVGKSHMVACTLAAGDSCNSCDHHRSKGDIWTTFLCLSIEMGPFVNWILK